MKTTMGFTNKDKGKYKLICGGKNWFKRIDFIKLILIKRRLNI